MPETVREEIIAMGAEMAVHTTAKNLKRAQIALSIAVAILSIGMLVAGYVLVRASNQDCRVRQERVEATRRVWNAVFDEIEEMNGPGSDPGLDRLQLVVDEELPPLNC